VKELFFQPHLPLLHNVVMLACQFASIVTGKIRTKLFQTCEPEGNKKRFWVVGEGPTIVIRMKFTHKISIFGAFKNVISNKK